MLRFAIALLGLFSFSLAAEDAPEPITLTELAARSDLVVLAQVRDTDYRTRRDLPVSGSAYLRPLITYKGAGDVEIFEVYESGRFEHACYFPNPTVFEEGRRYLLFLVRDAEEPERYRGHPQGCAITVLVEENNRYALAHPADGILLRDDLAALARPMRFADRYALVADDDLLPARREDLLAQKAIEEHGEQAWRYTQGIPLPEARQLIAPGALKD